MTTSERATAITETEAWFDGHGLPFFVEGRRIELDALVRGWPLVVLVPVWLGSMALAVPTERTWPWRIGYVAAGLLLLLAGWAVTNLVRRRRALERPARVGLVELTVFVLGPAAVVLVLRGDPDMAIGTLLVDAAVLGLVASVAVLHVVPVARWSLARTFSELGSLFRLVTRALPMLLLFTTFLFINTEVWQVASSLSRSVLWLTVAFFAGLAVTFLLVRLPEEVAAVNDQLDDDVVRRALPGTPLEAHQDDLGDVHAEPLNRAQRTNLLLVLLVAQVAQVMLLATTVWLYFLVFGRVAITDDVIASWVGGTAPTFPPLAGQLGFSNELLQVSIFLAAFSGLYFTVYAVTDTTYREQFFTGITREMETAVGVRAAYVALCRRREAR